ncbi:MAG: FAD-dependent oxidoreductase, partial [Candidatus Hydrogenedentes bacterium]|nr:FAD-dependent oxidoreductase [Candidatus Hydrogenedentota bacterium]
MDRRSFLSILSSTPFLLSNFQKPREYKADIAIIGGGTGGVACALSALGHGAKVILTEETDWLGGQFTSQGVPPDENPWVETFGSTKRYKEFRNAIREYYKRNYPLKDEHKNNPYLNPGNGNVSRLCHEPKVSAIVINSLLSHYETMDKTSKPQLRIMKKHKPTKVITKGDKIQAVCLLDLDHGEELWVQAEYFVDATETGELLHLGKVEYVTGMESKKDTGEPHASSTGEPKAMQACTWCFAMEYIPGADFSISKPQNYEFWKSFIPKLEPPWPGPLFSFTTSHPVTLEPRTLPLDPEGNEPKSWWRYRQILDKTLFDSPTIKSSITLVN